MGNENKLELSRRKALAGIGGIGVASAGAGLGTSAYFSDQGSFEENSLTAGELDLRIDWQQLYWGPEENTENYAPYGAAGRPFVNAHPDIGGNDPDGEQSLDTDDLDGFDDEGVVRYSDTDGGANIQEYLTCETLENFDIPDDFHNGVEPEQESLIELQDVKPGDCGEVTFSLHLCDNPGYVWWVGEVGESFDEDLARAIRVTAWYDRDCTNEFDPERDEELAGEYDDDGVVVESTDLQTFLNDRLSPSGRLLDPSVYEAGIEGGTLDVDGCVDLDVITFDGDGPELDNGEIIEVTDDPSEDLSLLGLEDDELVVVGSFETSDGNGSQFVVVFSDITYLDDDGDEVVAGIDEDASEIDWETIVEFDWDIYPDTLEYTVDGDTYRTSEDTGFCELVIGTGETAAGEPVELGCSDARTNVGAPNGETIDTLSFSYCEDERSIECFPGNETFCVAFEWCFPERTPAHVDDINDLQGRSVSFDLGFYTEQCRHNGEPSGPSESLD